MLTNTYRTPILALAVLMLAGTALLVGVNAARPGLCPAYPLIGWPACIVVLIYFTAITAALFLHGVAGQALFVTAALLTLVTGLGFSTLEITTAGHQCPQLFGIPLPLCFTVPPAVALMLYLAWRGRPARKSDHSAR